MATAASTAWNRRNPERHLAHVRRGQLKDRYGITPEQYDEMLDAQGGVCAVCASECPTGQRLAVDHNHLTDAVRGLLCVNCNRGIGHFNDNQELLLAAVDYLERQGI